jgi:hypothetical protein
MEANPDLSASFLVIAHKLRDSQSLTDAEATQLVHALFLPIVIKRTPWVRAFLEENPSANSDHMALAQSLAAEFWDTISSSEWWGEILSHDSVRALASANVSITKQSLQIQGIARKMVFCIFRDRARYPSLGRQLGVLVHHGVLVSSDQNGAIQSAQRLDNDTYLSTPECLDAPVLPSETTLDRTQFSFPVSRRQDKTAVEIKDTPGSVQARTYLKSTFPQGITNKVIEPLIREIFKKYPYRIPFQELNYFLVQGYQYTPLPPILNNDDEYVSQVDLLAADNPAAWESLEDKEDHQQCLQQIDEIYRQSSSPKQNTFKRFTIWNGLPTQREAGYTLALYTQHYGIPTSTVAEHNQYWKKELSLIFHQFASIRYDILIEAIRCKYFYDKPEFVCWSPSIET